MILKAAIQCTSSGNPELLAWIKIKSEPPQGEKKGVVASIEHSGWEGLMVGLVKKH